MANEKKGVPAWGVALILAAVLVPLLGITSAIAIYGVRRYIMNAKSAEGRANVVVLAKGIASCASGSGSLPSTSAAVPSKLASVSGMKYLASPGEWADPTLRCAGFSVKDPQYFQYQWVLLGRGRGEARARADLDGDGVPELSFSAPIDCRAGSCALGALVEVGTGTGVPAGRAARAPSSGSSATSDEPSIVVTVLVVTAWLVAIVGGIWGLVVAFQESVAWGLLSMFVPCAHYVFVIKFWDRAKKPFFVQVGALLLFGAAVVGSAFSEFSRGKRTTPVAAVESTAEAAPPAPPAPPKVTGNAVDLSTLMGRARASADSWQREATLSSIDATISQGLVQTGEGATATLVFGPSPFGKPGERTGRFVVTYDSSGLHSASSEQPAGKALIEPMCAPETAYQRATGSSGARVTVHYGLDSRGKNAVWLIRDASDAKPSAFDSQHCALAAP
jgi:hypothetical protein